MVIDRIFSIFDKKHTMEIYALITVLINVFGFIYLRKRIRNKYIVYVTIFLLSSIVLPFFILYFDLFRIPFESIRISDYFLFCAEFMPIAIFLFVVTQFTINRFIK